MSEPSLNLQREYSFSNDSKARYAVTMVTEFFGAPVVGVSGTALDAEAAFVGPFFPSSLMAPAASASFSLVRLAMRTRIAEIQLTSSSSDGAQRRSVFFGVMTLNV